MTIKNIENSLQYQEMLEDLENKNIIKITSSTCAPCKMMTPLFEKLASEETNIKIKYYSLVGDQNGDLTSLVKNLGINSVPVFLIIESGAIIKRVGGAMPLSKLKESLGV